MSKALRRTRKYLSEKKGEIYVDKVVMILIIVVIGAALMFLLNTAMPGLFQSVITKITNDILGVNVPTPGG